MYAFAGSLPAEMDNRDNYTAPISIRCTEGTREKLEKLAANDNRPLAQYVRLVLERHVEGASPGSKKAGARAS